MARTIRLMLEALGQARNLAVVGSSAALGLHQLSGSRSGQFAVTLVQPYRLVFQLSNHPIPLRADGGIDTSQVTAVTILEVVDYH